MKRRIMPLPFYSFIVKKGRAIRQITLLVHCSLLYKPGSLFWQITSPLLDFILTHLTIRPYIIHLMAAFIHSTEQIIHCNQLRFSVRLLIRTGTNGWSWRIIVDTLIWCHIVALIKNKLVNSPYPTSLIGRAEWEFRDWTMFNNNDRVNLHVIFIPVFFSSYHVVTESKENLWDWVLNDACFS